MLDPIALHSSMLNLVVLILIVLNLIMLDWVLLDMVVLHPRISPDSARLGSPQSKHALANSALLGSPRST